jgi:dUTP pyrophosphatase
MKLKIKKLRPGAVIPKYATEGAACFDLCAVINEIKPVPVFAGQPVTFATGLSFEIPEGWVMLIFSRSGHGFNSGVRLANCTGVIDSDYRGEVGVKLTKDQDAVGAFEVRNGDRIAQAMLVQVPLVELVEVEELSNTERGTGGFGSTGK